MAHRTRLPNPTPQQLQSFLDAAGLKAHDAAPLIDVSRQAIQMALTGKRRMAGNTWLLLRVIVSRSARAELPEPIVD